MKLFLEVTILEHIWYEYIYTCIPQNANKAAAAADGDLEEAEALSKECCICLEAVAHGDKVSVLPCGHR